MRKPVIVLAVLAIVIVLLPGVGVGASLLLENQNAFCAACHTQPEDKYYQQSLQTPVTTLASFHVQKQANCIDCHSGGGPLGRAQGIMQGADDLMLYLSGNFKSPAVTSNPLGDDSCLKCHPEVLTRGRRQPPSPIQNPVQVRGRRGNDRHYHQFLQRWQAADPRAAHCVNCHTSHTDGASDVGFMTADPVQQVCDGCHRGLNVRD
jgi:predicted CXXCH cytochrome family protein